VLHRLRAAIDSHSYLETYHNPETRVVIVFVHGIWGNYKETWAATPLQLVSSPVLALADYGSFGYGTTYIDFAKPDRVVDQFVLWARTNLARYQQIFLVAHSMGGLIVRDACARLALSDVRDDRQLYSKIRHCFLVAVPLSGSWLARLLNRIPPLRWLNQKIPYLAQSAVSPSSMSRYRAALERAEVLGVQRPRFALFIGTDDILVSEPHAWAVTKDDRYEGPVPGSHESIKVDQDANSTLIRRITQVITDDVLSGAGTQKAIRDLTAKLEAPGRQAAPVPQDRVKHSRDVLLISCSAGKSNEGRHTHPGVGGIAQQVADQQVAILTLQLRVKIMNLIQQGSIDGVEFEQGNRAARPENAMLALGPDFGGALNSPRYLPAFLRYRGRTYQASEEEWRGFFARPVGNRPDILIMSGLYGLLPAEENIQNYDCHITDLDTQSGFTVRDYWGRILTDILVSHLEWLEQQGYTIGRIFDVLSEYSYQTAIDWQAIYPRWPVMHRVFERRAGRNALANMGRWLQTIIADPSSIRGLKADEFFEVREFLDPDQMAFETRLGESRLAVARE